MKIIKISTILILLCCGLAGVTEAATSSTCHELEIQLPGLSGCINGPGNYLAGIYKLSLGVGVFLAAMVIVMAGIKYATAGDNSSKQKEAREDIFQAIFGLLILFGSVIILRTINPDLANLGLWSNNLPQFVVPNGVIDDSICRKQFNIDQEQCNGDIKCINNAKVRMQECLKEQFKKFNYGCNVEVYCGGIKNAGTRLCERKRAAADPKEGIIIYDQCIKDLKSEIDQCIMECVFKK
jgi:hypothetical protein